MGWNREHLDNRWPYPLEWVRDEWMSRHIWKRGARVIVRNDRGKFYLSWIRDAYQATRNRVEAGDEAWAREYARGAAHWAHKYIKGVFK